jgi:hypothetical protein
LVFALFSVPRAFGSSTISQSYERTIYGSKGEVLSYIIDLSIQTEADGTWRNDTRYLGQVTVELNWYNTTLFPYEIWVVFERPTYYSPVGVNCTFQDYNITLAESSSSASWGVVFGTPSLPDSETEVFYEYAPIMPIDVYGISPPFTETLFGNYGFQQPAIYITITNGSVSQPTNQQLASLTSLVQQIENSLGNTQNLVYVLIALIVLLGVINLVLVYSMGESKKPSKIDDTKKTT